MKCNLPAIAIHPGELLLEEFLKPMGMSQTEFARHVGISYKRLNQIVNGKRPVTAEISWLFSQAFGMLPQFWLNCQVTYDLVTNKPKKKIRRIKMSS